jgi:hypothetical protein
VKVVTYQSSDAQDKVLAFYQKALGRYGDVIECDGQRAVGSPAVTHEGLDCSDDQSKAHVKISENTLLSLKAGSKRHQHIFAVQKSDGPGTRFTLVELQLPEGMEKEPPESN